MKLFDFVGVKPVLKWVGGKRELVPEIRNYYKHLSPENYVEPFFGGGSVYFDVLKVFGSQLSSNSIINDINTDLIGLYRNIKQHPSEIIYHCKELEKDYYKYGYYHIRGRFNGIDNDKNPVERYDGIERSSALILLNKTCFNGLYRTNMSGLFNVPEGRYKNPRIVDEENLFELSSVLPKVQNIRNINFNEITDIEEGDLCYFDPPYHPISTTSSFTDYSGSFKAEEQIKLMNYFKSLDEKGVFVIESNSACDFIKELYSEFKIVEVQCSRNINSKSEKRGKINEYLILGNTLYSKLKQENRI